MRPQEFRESLWYLSRTSILSLLFIKSIYSSWSLFLFLSSTRSHSLCNSGDYAMLSSEQQSSKLVATLDILLPLKSLRFTSLLIIELFQSFLQSLTQSEECFQGCITGVRERKGGAPVTSLGSQRA
ncbi:hypothetical protein FGO68_gene11683 [Halteria grandinella]|uniref:Uncharacterized protein n=1 Tax=Halteria grandinella TaxID=5974 RepID=A0A8J8T9R6_HALGN|nr:hypothetical protein FGO68_gene11683 [Halteria grandinella]